MFGGFGASPDIGCAKRPKRRESALRALSSVLLLERSGGGRGAPGHPDGETEGLTDLLRFR